MQIYLVGGAVRDQCLGLPGKDRDWVVVGATPAQMLSQGYRPVGRDFPVFLHPQTHEEYALARTERKQGHGYRGFITNHDPGVTLEQDLQRRDLTINAMARDQHGHIIDPYGGQRDLRQRLLRHVSPAFREDPLRVLRVARFAARYASLGFTVAPETMSLMREISTSGELTYLPGERVWQELRQALCCQQPSRFFQVLQQAKALHALLPELSALHGVPQTPCHHPEIDSLRHTLMALDLAATESAEEVVCFALLMHDLGKGLTFTAQWPRHIGHERAGLEPIQQLCQRLRCPSAYRELATQVCQWHLHVHQAMELRPQTLLKLLSATDALRRPQRFSQFLLACAYDARGRLGLEHESYPQQAFMRRLAEHVNTVDISDLLDIGLGGKTLGVRIQQRRLDAIRDFRKIYDQEK
ncbi:MAG: multifunctional CCA addition/repair protein [Wenzhouxiangellaceae bacterium]